MKTFDEIKEIYAGRKPRPIGDFNYYSVLVPFVEKHGELYILYEVRAYDMERQPGEVCFPGGHIEKGETAENCAIRETFEEIGIPKENIEIIGPGDLNLGISGSEFVMHTFLGKIDYEDYLNAKLETSEVAEIFLVPLSAWKNIEVKAYERKMNPVVTEKFPYEEVGISTDYKWGRSKADILVSQYDGKVIWGMTLKVTLNICETLGIRRQGDYEHIK